MRENLNLSWEQQVELFRNRGMDISNDNLHKIQNISYYRLKEFARPLAKTTKKENEILTSYEGVKFNEVLTRYYQDKNLRMVLLHAIEKVEVSVKTRISNILGSYYGAFGYLNFSQWSNKSKYTKFHVEKIQHSIKKNLLKITEKTQNTELRNAKNLDQDGFPSVWLGVDLLMFGDVVRLLEIMNESKLRMIANYYGCSNDELISWMKCLNFIRNICAHNSNLIDIKLATKPKIRKEWYGKLFFIEKEKDGKISRKPTNRLAVVFLIVFSLVRVINPKYKWRNIQLSINKLVDGDEKRANMLGFRDVVSSKCATRIDTY